MRVRRVIGQTSNDVLVSAASAWETTTKQRLGKLDGIESLTNDLPGWLAQEGFAMLPITLAHALRAGTMAGPVRDPFDRMLIAQSLLEDMSLVSNEAAFDEYKIKRLW